MQIKFPSLFFTVILALHLCILFSTSSVQASPASPNGQHDIDIDAAERSRQEVAAAISEPGTTSTSSDVSGGTESERRQLGAYLRALDTAIQRSRDESTGPSGSVPFMSKIAAHMGELLASPEYAKQRDLPPQGDDGGRAQAEQQKYRTPNRDDLIAISVHLITGFFYGIIECNGIVGVLKLTLTAALDTVIGIIKVLM